MFWVLWLLFILFCFGPVTDLFYCFGFMANICFCCFGPMDNVLAVVLTLKLLFFVVVLAL